MKVRVSSSHIMISFLLSSWSYSLINLALIDRSLFIGRFSQLPWGSRYFRNLRIKLFSDRGRSAKPYSAYSVSSALKEKQCIKQLKHFNKHVETTTTKLTLSLLRQIHDLTDIQHELKNHWDLKIADNMQWSDSVREEDVESYWLTKEWISNCCLSNLDEKFISLYRNSFSTISSTDFSSHDSSRFFWESRSLIVTKLFSSNQNVFELRCHFDLISSESHTHLRALWLLDDLKNQ